MYQTMKEQSTSTSRCERNIKGMETYTSHWNELLPTSTLYFWNIIYIIMHIVTYAEIISICGAKMFLDSQNFIGWGGHYFICN